MTAHLCNRSAIVKLLTAWVLADGAALLVAGLLVLLACI
jgi:hypothetical protein